MKITSRHIVFTGILVLLATACKYFFGPNLEWSGFSPVIAIALFSGFIMKERNLSFVLPFVALLLSDVFIQFLYSVNLFPYAGFYSTQWINYSILLACTLVGWMLKGRNLASLATGAVAAPTAYFLLSNLSVWSSSVQTLYPKTFAGLLTCYEAGLPFYRNSIIASLVFLPIILISYNYITKHKTEITLA